MTRAGRLAVAVLATLLGCLAGDPRPDGTEARMGEPFRIRRGQSAALEGLSLRISFSSVKGDSRCPKSVVCVWEGDASIVVTVGDGGKTHDVELHTNARFATSAEAYGVSLTLVDLVPYPDHPRDEHAKAAVAELVVRPAPAAP